MSNPSWPMIHILFNKIVFFITIKLYCFNYYLFFMWVQDGFLPRIEECFKWWIAFGVSFFVFYLSTCD